jgi:hypothetical protein
LLLQLLNNEREKLILLAIAAETELSDSASTTLPEEAAGKLRSAAGKARLLASQKMKQFEGLCQKNIVSVFISNKLISIFILDLRTYLSFAYRIKCLAKNFQRRAKIWLDFGIWLCYK